MNADARGSFIARLIRVSWPLLAAVSVGLVIVWLSGSRPTAVIHALAYGAFGSPANLATTLTRATPLLLTGLSVAVAFRGGLFNIGAEGQLMMGALAAAWLGSLNLGLPRILHLPVLLGAAAAAGALWGGLPGWLKARRGVHEVISTIMLNHIAIQVTDYLVNGPLGSETHIARTGPLVPEARVPVIWQIAPSNVSWGPVVACICCGVVAWFLFRTASGFEIRAVGLGPDASEACGIPSRRITVLAMGLAGALAGLAGGLEVSGVHHTLYARFSSGDGFVGIAVALLARNHPLGVLPAAFLLGGLRTADRWLQLAAGVPRDLVLIIQALAILAVGLQGGLVRLSGRRHEVHSEK